MQGELKTVKEFRRKRAEMQQQLADLQGELEEAELQHKSTLSQMEQRFFEEKVGCLISSFSVPVRTASMKMCVHQYLKG